MAGAEAGESAEMTKFVIKLYLALWVSLVFPPVLSTDARIASQNPLALVDFCDSAAGPNRKRNNNCLRGPASMRYGVTMRREKMTEVPQSASNLKVPIPSSIGQFSALAVVGLSENGLKGLIPSGIGNLTSHELLNFSWNQLEGAMPLELANFIDLNGPWLDGNQFTGLPNLRSLHGLSEDIVLILEDIEPNNGVVSQKFLCASRDSVGVSRNTAAEAGETLHLMIRVGGCHKVRRWKEEEVPIPGATDEVLVILSATLNDSGAYTYEIANTVATEFMRHSRLIQVQFIHPHGVVLYFVWGTFRGRGQPFWPSVYARSASQPGDGLKEMHFTLQYDSSWPRLVSKDSIFGRFWTSNIFGLSTEVEAVLRRMAASMTGVTGTKKVDGPGEIARIQWKMDAISLDAADVALQFVSSGEKINGRFLLRIRLQCFAIRVGVINRPRGHVVLAFPEKNSALAIGMIPYGYCT